MWDQLIQQLSICVKLFDPKTPLPPPLLHTSSLSSPISTPPELSPVSSPLTPSQSHFDSQVLHHHHHHLTIPSLSLSSSSPSIPTLNTSSSSNNNNNNATTTVSFHVSSVAKGLIQVEGYRIISGKLNFRMKQHKHTMETTIRRSEPYVLHQIQRAHHLLNGALADLKKTRVTHHQIVGVGGSGSRGSHGALSMDHESSHGSSCRGTGGGGGGSRGGHGSVHQQSHAVNTLILILEDVMAAVQQARENIVVTDNSVMEEATAIVMPSAANATAAMSASVVTSSSSDSLLSPVTSTASGGESTVSGLQQMQMNRSSSGDLTGSATLSRSSSGHEGFARSLTDSIGSGSFLTSPSNVAKQESSYATTMMLAHNTANTEMIPVQQTFYPPLPKDTVVLFKICEDARLHISIYHVHFVNATVASNRGDLQQPNKPWFVSSKSGEVALVTEEFTTTCVLSHVNTALVHMTAVFKQCVRLRDKLSVHRAYCTM